MYICESRVDKTARLFNKISKHKYPTCTKFYVFKDFDLKLKLTRSYTVKIFFYSQVMTDSSIFSASSAPLSGVQGCRFEGFQGFVQQSFFIR